MDDHRAVRRVVFTRIRQVEPLRILIVELNGAELPRAANGIEHVEVDLGAVERAVARLEFVFIAGGFERLTQRRLRTVPRGVGSNALRRTCRKLEPRRETERFVIPENEA